MRFLCMISNGEKTGETSTASSEFEDLGGEVAEEEDIQED